jgi:broad specificity phosphatase PhoE
MTLYVIRHGETIWNVAGRVQGQKDSPLTERGRRQAETVGQLLALTLGATGSSLRAYVSPLGRARATAGIIARFVELDQLDEPRLAEVGMGSWDGMTKFEIETEYPGALAGASAFDWFFRSPDGETFETVRERVSSWLSELRTPAVAITHRISARIAMGVFLGLTTRQMLELPVPQDGFYELADRKARFICETGSIAVPASEA